MNHGRRMITTRFDQMGNHRIRDNGVDAGRPKRKKCTSAGTNAHRLDVVTAHAVVL